MRVSLRIPSIRRRRDTYWRVWPQVFLSLSLFTRSRYPGTNHRPMFNNWLARLGFLGVKCVLLLAALSTISSSTIGTSDAIKNFVSIFYINFSFSELRVSIPIYSKCFLSFVSSGVRDCTRSDSGKCGFGNTYPVKYPMTMRSRCT